MSAEDLLEESAYCSFWVFYKADIVLKPNLCVNQKMVGNI